MKNLFSRPVDGSEGEFLEILLERPGVRIERIISTGQTTPTGEWYDQLDDEWVVLIKGAAKIRFEAEESQIEMRPGDHLLIPARMKHRVEWTSTETESVWIAVFVTHKA